MAAVVVFCLASSYPYRSQPQSSVKVIGITDGDTLTVIDSKRQTLKVRLAGIDAPEKGQDFGVRAQQSLSELVYGKDVTLLSRKVDRYGRLVGKILIGSLDANLEQIRRGFAWHYKEYESEQSASDRKDYRYAERLARLANVGLWSLPKPIEPSAFRSQGNQSIPTVFSPPTSRSPGSAGAIIGNSNSLIYHMPGCHSYGKVAPQNRVYFATAQQAAAAGYRRARNC